MLHNLLVLLHVITAAAWFGLALVIGGMARRVAADGGASLVEEGSKTVKMMTAFIVLTFVFGFLAFLLGGGFVAYGPVYHASLLLVLILVAVQLFVIAPSWKRLALGGEAAGSARKRITTGIGMGHLIWLIVLVLMFWNHFPLA